MTTSSNHTYLRDIYDGKVWHDFHSFLSQPFSYLLTLNVNGFNHFYTHNTRLVVYILQCRICLVTFDVKKKHHAKV